MVALIAGIFVAFMCVLTFTLYAVDKRKATDGKWRISEATLLLCSLFGGAMGGCLAMKLLRHKTKHWYFRVVNILCALAHIALLVFLVYHEIGR